ncbi:3'-5' exonuclease, partial [Acinetobacter baumannii]
GTPLKELPRPYISWLLNKEDLDPHLRKALQNI